MQLRPNWCISDPLSDPLSTDPLSLRIDFVMGRVRFGLETRGRVRLGLGTRPVNRPSGPIVKRGNK